VTFVRIARRPLISWAKAQVRGGRHHSPPKQVIQRNVVECRAGQQWSALAISSSEPSRSSPVPGCILGIGSILNVVVMGENRIGMPQTRQNSAHDQVVRRARIVLEVAGGLNAGEIAAAVGKSLLTVRRWRQRYVGKGAEGLLKDHRLRTDYAGPGDLDHHDGVIFVSQDGPRPWTFASRAGVISCQAAGIVSQQ
jgi:hypothetical protein